MSLFETTTLAASDVADTGSVADAVRTRANVFEMTHAAEDAVLRPKDAGAFPHNLRAALAARMSAQAGDQELAARFANSADGMTEVSNPAESGGSAHGDLIAFVDKAANATKDISGDDIKLLQTAGFSDADIVKLCELVAFVSYQLRVVAGLRLMRGPTS